MGYTQISSLLLGLSGLRRLLPSQICAEAAILDFVRATSILSSSPVSLSQRDPKFHTEDDMPCYL